MSVPMCHTPGSVLPQDLAAWAEGAADDATRLHLETCAACRGQALAYLGAVRQLTTGLYRADCPSTDVLGEYTMDLLPAAERTAVAVHLVSCGHCTEELAALRADVAEPAVPVAGAAPWLERLVTAIATVMTPDPQPGMAGTRGAASGDQPATYTAGDVQITLHVAPREGPVEALTVRGLVTSAAHSAELLARSRVDLLSGETIIASADLNARGHFVFADLAAGDYTVQVSFPDQAVVIPALSLAP